MFGDNQPPDNTGWWVGVLGGIGGVLTITGTVLINLITSRSKVRREERADTILEWHNLAHELQERYDKLLDRSDEMQKQMNVLHSNHAECEKRSAKQEGEIRLLQNAMQRLQVDNGDTLSGIGVTATIIADLDGIIRTVSPSISSLLHWLPKDLVGKNVEMLVPERFRSEHSCALLKVKEGSSVPWTERTILSFALTGDRSPEVPVAITLTLLTSEKGSGDRYITADLRRRMLEDTERSGKGHLSDPDK